MKFLPLGLILFEVLLVYLLVFLKRLVVSVGTLILGYVLPGCFDGGKLVAVDGLHIAGEHRSNCTTIQRFSLIHLGSSLLHDLVSEQVDPINKFPPQCMFGELV
jgi:hypothetical protein